MTLGSAKPGKLWVGPKLYGILLVIISAASFGAMAVLALVAYRAGTNPITLLFMRFAIAGSIMAVVMSARGVVFPRGKLLLSLVLMGGLVYVTQTLVYFTALTMASPSLVALLLYLYPALVALLAVVLLKEPITRPKVFALALALIGMVLTIGPEGRGGSLGVILALSAALIYSIYIVAGDKLLKQVSPLAATTVIMMAAGMVYGGIVAIQGFKSPSTTVGWVAILATALFSIIAIGAFMAGIERVGSTNAAVLSTIEPVVVVLLAALLLGEAVEPLRLVGGLFILLTVVFLARTEFAGA
jgi:drug/metabolite transporter (DMT)-like permease